MKPVEPFKNERPINIELFSCAGGAAEGFKRAGILFDLVIDKDLNACTSYAQNIGHRPVQMDAEDFLRIVRLGVRPAGRVRLFVADPPCTPWSRSGKRKGLDDHRDQIMTTVELVELLQPFCWLIANVPGLDDGPNLETVQKTIGRLGKHYFIQYTKLDAARFGVPQHRVRPFWFGHARDLPHLSWPVPTHGPSSRNLPIEGTAELPFVTVRDALQHLSGRELGTPIRLRYRKDKGHPPSTIDAPAKTVLADNPRLDKGGAVLAVPPAPTLALVPPPTAQADLSTPVSSDDRPARALTANTHSGGALLVAGGRSRAYAGHKLTVPADPHGHPVSVPEAPAPCITTSGGRGGRRATTLLVHERHPISDADAPARAIVASDGGGARGSRVTTWPAELSPNAKHPVNRPDQPSHAITTKDRGGQGGMVAEWPWNRPATTVQSDERLSPPGHHEMPREVVAGRGKSANAIKLSERAATILQGFPEAWKFSGKTKRARWGQIGQAMPPGLMEPVARQIKRYLDTHFTEDHDP